ncbi:MULTISPECIES: carbohydrate kinase family protein [unclassified Mesorhizobium]|uniref:carbohydrate kinase family protein n=1 Tax=unclassified Mesorhizobium TaxID=325217 RepID=UPI000465E2BF|nr:MULTISPECIES: carbohydrate kinase family protein [unclassified Mesorhizobium]
MNQPPKLFAAGGAHIDRRGQVAGAYVPAASNPGTMREDVGGGVFNALRTVVRRGVSASLISTRGGDGAGETVARAIAEAGIADLSATFLDRTTPSYTAILDRDGELVVGFADMGLYELAFPKQMRRASVRTAVDQADAVLTDANLPTAALERLTATAGEKPVFVIAISPAKVVRLAPIFERPAVLFMNRREASALTGLARDAGEAELVAGLRGIGLRGGVVTAGDRPALGFDKDGAFSIAPPPPRAVVDVTGAGDALAGATVAALLHGQPLRAALREGVAAAGLAIESPLAIPDFTPASFAAALALVPQAREVA